MIKKSWLGLLSGIIILTVFISAVPAENHMNWQPTNEKKLDGLFETGVENAIAVFDADGTLWRDDVGEGFLRWLIQERKLKDVDYSQNIYAKYEAMCDMDTRRGYAYAVQLMKGLKEVDVKKWADAYFQKEYIQRIFPLQQKLIALLEINGATVWIVSASNQWIVESGADALGIPRNRVVGIRVKVENGVLTDQIIEPVTYRQGKVDAIDKYIGQQPIFVSGNSMTDYEMLRYSKGLSLVINPKDSGTLYQNLAKLADLHGWMVEHW